MATITRVDVGTRVARRHDGATGVVVNRRMRTDVARALFGHTVLDIRLDAEPGVIHTMDLTFFVRNFSVRG